MSERRKRQLDLDSGRSDSSISCSSVPRNERCKEGPCFSTW